MARRLNALIPLRHDAIVAHRKLTLSTPTAAVNAPQITGVTMSNPKDLPIDDSSADKNPDDYASGGGDASGLPRAADSPSVSPDETTEIENATAAAAAVADHLQLGRSKKIDAYRLTYEGLERFGHDDAAVGRFTTELFRRNELTADEAKEGTSSSKLSKYRLAGEYADCLIHPELRPYVDRGYTAAYRVAHRIKYQPGKTHEERLARFLKKLRATGERLTKKFLEKEAAAAKNLKAAAHWHARHQNGMLRPRCSEGLAADLVLITPNVEQIKDSIDSQKNRSAYIGDLTEGAIGIAVTPFRYSCVMRKLLEKSGFTKFTHVLLTKQPAKPDIVDAKIVIIAGAPLATHKRIQEKEITWLKQPNNCDWRKIVERWIPDAMHKRHAYAQDAAEGWECIDPELPETAPDDANDSIACPGDD